jgi:peptidoglycan/xylan/chitin deacetylase (PgdA/CDA1 family)
VISTEQFRQQLEYLCSNYEVVPLDQIVACLQAGKDMPRRAVAITFDDAYRDVYLDAYPYLRQHRAPATVFLTTGNVGSPIPFWWDRVHALLQRAHVTTLDAGELGSYRLESSEQRWRAAVRLNARLRRKPTQTVATFMEQLAARCQVQDTLEDGQAQVMSWEEARELAAAGIRPGAHTVSHPNLLTLSPSEARHEMLQSRRDIEENTGQRATALAYPYGAHSPTLHRLAQECGFACAVTVAPARPLRYSDDLYALPRVSAPAELNLLKVLLSGIWGDLQGLFVSSQAYEG